MVLTTMATSALHEVVANATNIVDSTKSKYLRDLDQWVDFAGTDPKGWTRKKAQAFYAGLLKRIKPQSANRLMATIRFAAKWYAVQEGNEAVGNFAIVQEAKPNQVGHKQALTAEQAKLILDSCRYIETDPVDCRDFAMIVLGLETGMRRMSVRSMTVEHTFLRGEARTGYPIARVLMKGTGNERVAVPLSDTVVRCLDRWLKTLQPGARGPVFQALAKHRIEKPGKGEQTIHRASGQALSESAINKIIVDRTEKAGIRISPHVFRHTYVTWRMEAGYTPHQVAAVTGHKLTELGALGQYIDPKSVGALMRASTPDWLEAYVKSRLG